jgi:hypothetical protein
VCFWEDDGSDELDHYSGPNHETLREGRKNFLELGACDEKALSHVLPVSSRKRFKHHPRVS